MVNYQNKKPYWFELTINNSPLIIIRNRGFTIIELLIVVAIIGALGAVGMPMYNGYIATTKESVAQNSLRSIYLMEQDYYSENSSYYTNSTTGNHTADINSTLFQGVKTLDESGDFYFYIQSVSSGYNAYAVPTVSGLTTFCLDHNNSFC